MVIYTVPANDPYRDCTVWRMGWGWWTNRRPPKRRDAVR